MYDRTPSRLTTTGMATRIVSTASTCGRRHRRLILAFSRMNGPAAAGVLAVAPTSTAETRRVPI